MSEIKKKQTEDVKNVKFDDELTDDDDDFKEGPSVEILELINMTNEIKNQALEIILTRYVIVEIIDDPVFEKIAENIKREMDKRFGGRWHCVMGRGFGFDVSFNDNCLIYLCIDEAIGVVLWKC